MTSLSYLTTCCVVVMCVLNLVLCEKYKLCIVEGKGKLKKSLKYCPHLDKADSKVECVTALDRTECLRLISKGKADFSVFYPEDLITANNEGVQILVTNEIRYTDVPYEYEVVAVVDKNSGINSRHDLKGKRYCHPGFGDQIDWTKILLNYFEASVVTPSCDPNLTLIENKIKASGQYFGSSCKAGTWVNDVLLDLELSKKKYPQLCALCGDPYKCSAGDKYWGRRGSLFCLTDGAGDISWAILEDVQPHFGLVPGSAEASADDYRLLCPDDTLMPLNSSDPCVWVVKPWPVVASRRSVADDVQKIISSLSHNIPTTSWSYKLLMLLETYYSTIYTLPALESIETYLDKATGFLSANSFSGCHPPRTVRVCTTSIIESAKCSWMRESAAAFGIEPDLECIKADNTTHCMLALTLNAADVVMVPTDLVHIAQRKFNLKTLFYEIVPDSERYLTVAVTRPGTKISSFADLAGKKACFPSFDGIAWNTAKNVLFQKNLIKLCPLDDEMFKFFGPSCTPGLSEDHLNKQNQNCDDTYKGDFGALHCLASEMGDVAFVSQNSIGKFVSDPREDNPGNRLSLEDFNIFCENKSAPCYLSWAPVGQAMIRANTTNLWIKDSLDVFLQLDGLFGKNYKSITNAFTMFGRYEHMPNLLFHDETQKLRVTPNTKDTDSITYIFEAANDPDNKCIKSSAYRIVASYQLFLNLAFYVGNILILKTLYVF